MFTYFCHKDERFAFINFTYVPAELYHSLIMNDNQLN
ncbi:MAG: hypothetical protein K0S53_779 [Bacteroidetes bacterium]|jgi:hypothetical protein|nr:hypothetical protein [Bacteroidota bacterium]MDF2451502.1 hypothetical protein [Bacteroidota bacterium]